MLDVTASGQDAAPVPDRDTASGNDAAPHPDQDTASGEGAAPNPDRDTVSGQDEPEIEPGSAHDGSASGQISRDPPSKRRRTDNGDEDADQGVEMPCEDAPPQESRYPQTNQMVDKKGLREPV